MRVTDVDKVFKALADPSRRQLLDRLYAESGQTLTELCQHLDMRLLKDVGASIVDTAPPAKAP